VRPPKVRTLDLVVLGLTLVLAGCNEGPAEEALAAAQAALEDARAGLERYAPQDLARLEGELSAAREALAEGRYTEALRVAQDLPESIRVAADRAAGRRGVLESAWEDLSRTVPGRLGRLRTRLRDVTSGPTPAGDEPWVQSAWVRLRRLEGRWSAASDAFQGGRVSRAVAEARAVDAGIDELSEALGCAPGC
jgi:hypothetical protein